MDTVDLIIQKKKMISQFGVPSRRLYVINHCRCRVTIVISVVKCL